MFGAELRRWSWVQCAEASRDPASPSIGRMEWRKLDRIRKQLRRESLADKFIALVDVYALIVDGGGKGEGVLGSGVECGHQVTSSHCSVETK